MSTLVPPHGGGRLKPLLLTEPARGEELKRAENLIKIPLSSREISDLFMLGMGAYTPLDGFMGKQDWRGCCEIMTTENGLFWPIPITLSCSEDAANNITIGQEIALTDPNNNEVLAIQTVTEKYTIDKHFECQEVFRTTDKNHPGVQKVMQQAAVIIDPNRRVHCSKKTAGRR